MRLPFDMMKISFGIYRGKEVKDIPDDYLKFLLSKSILKGKLLFHCQVRFNLPKETFEVTVEDAAVGNGTYIVEAYNEKHAMSICRKDYNIQNTQSNHGTGWLIVKKEDFIKSKKDDI